MTRKNINAADGLANPFPASGLSIAETRFAAIDFEGAGAVPGLPETPVQIGISHMQAGEVTPALRSYVRPSSKVTWTAKKVHGITDEMVRNAPPLADLWPEIRASMEGRWIVAHGASTERRFLRAFPFHSFGPWVDTLVLVRAAYPSLASHSLGATVRALGLEASPELSAPGFRWHDAGCDATASLVLLRHVIHACGLAAKEPLLLLSPDLSDYFSARQSKPRR